jgi:serine/threonine-protein kinase RsbW
VVTDAGGTSGPSGAGAPGAASVADTVELEVPADPAYLAVLRTATAGLAARLDLTIDEIEDLRIAVDEACALVLGPQPLDGSTDRHAVEARPAAGLAGEGAATGQQVRPVLRARYELDGTGMRVEVSGPARTLPGRESFAWAVLEALVSGLDTGRDELGRHCIRLRHDGPGHGG